MFDTSLTTPLSHDQQSVKDLVNCCDQFKDAGGNSVANVQAHREKSDTNNLWCAMVTKTLPYGDPQQYSPEAKRALAIELDRLRSISTWDESAVIERSEAKRLYPDAHFARIFAIYGIKHHEMEESFHKWKARVVLGGDNIKDVDNDYAIFSDVGTTPSNICLLYTSPSPRD